MARSKSVSSLIVASLALSSSLAFADVTSDQCIDANAKAQGLRRDGKLTASRAQLQICVDTHCPAMVRDDCARRLDELDRLQPTIVFDGKDPAGGDVSAVVVTVDGRHWVDKLDGSPLAVDPGAHTFTFQAAGQPLVTRTLVVKEGEKGRIERVVLGTAPPSAPPAAVVVAVAPGRDALSSSPPREPAHRLGTRKVVALALGGVGVAGIAAGSVFGLLASSAWNSSKGACSQASCPASTRPQAVKDHDTAMTDGTLSDVAFIAGGALLVGGVALFFTAPAESDAPRDHAQGWRIVPLLGRRAAGLNLRGEF